MLNQVRTHCVHQSRVVDNEIWSFTQTKEEGFPLVLLPGAQGTGDIYFNQLLGIGQDIRVIAVTYPEVSDCQALANGFRSFLDLLGISRPVFFRLLFWGSVAPVFRCSLSSFCGGVPKIG